MAYDDLTEEMDVTGVNLRTIDQGSQLDPGWYKAVIEDVHDDPAKGDRTRKFVFRVTEGDFDGAKAYLTLGDPDSADDTEKAKKSRDRRMGMAVRLGLVARNAAGGVRFNFADATGAEVAIKITKQREKDERTGKWVETDRTQVDYMGVYLIDDPRVPAELRAAPATTFTGGTCPPDAPPPAGSAAPNRPQPRPMAPVGAAATVAQAANDPYADL